MNAQSHQQNPPPDEQAILAWLRQNAIPLQHIAAGHGFSDLQPLKEILADARVVGLGETTHGTREFFPIKHRLLEFLVTEMAFTAFVIEASYAACQPINEYVLHGRGDRATVLTGQGYIPWDTEEFSEMLAWLRVYNQGVPDKKKVSFHAAICDATR
jgi:erythromycin esterase